MQLTKGLFFRHHIFSKMLRGKKNNSVYMETLGTTEIDVVPLPGLVWRRKFAPWRRKKNIGRTPCLKKQELVSWMLVPLRTERKITLFLELACRRPWGPRWLPGARRHRVCDPCFRMSVGQLGGLLRQVHVCRGREHYRSFFLFFFYFLFRFLHTKKQNGEQNRANYLM